MPLVFADFRSTNCSMCAGTPVSRAPQCVLRSRKTRDIATGSRVLSSTSAHAMLFQQQGTIEKCASSEGRQFDRTFEHKGYRIEIWKHFEKTFWDRWNILRRRRDQVFVDQTVGVHTTKISILMQGSMVGLNLYWMWEAGKLCTKRRDLSASNCIDNQGIWDKWPIPNHIAFSYTMPSMTRVMTSFQLGGSKKMSDPMPPPSSKGCPFSVIVYWPLVMAMTHN